MDAGRDVVIVDEDSRTLVPIVIDELGETLLACAAERVVAEDALARAMVSMLRAGSQLKRERR